MKIDLERLQKMNANKLFLSVLGGFVLTSGMTFVLLWWPDVVSLFRGVIGMALALAGLLILYLVKD